uniref:STAT transcription factor protein interaction domain-containing protein n=1 Tax=Amazona collaria TaxID=241587 RepID=A0A8B9FDT3_9PSIT
MAQWQEVQNLANAYLEQIHQLYTGAALPMAVRQYLAARGGGGPLSSHARMLFHSMLALLGERLGSLGPGNEDFMLKHNLRKAHRDLQATFEDCPETFANVVANLLQEERRILRLGQAGGQVRQIPCAPPPSAPDGLCPTAPHVPIGGGSPSEDRSSDPHYAQQIQALQAKLQILDRQRREALAQMQQLLGRSETLRDFLVQELEAWRGRQQRACMGAPEDTSLRPLEAW